MIEGICIYDADAHVATTPTQWATLPPRFAARRPRPVQFGDPQGLANFTTAWAIDGQLIPFPWGAGAQVANTAKGAVDAAPGTAGNLDIPLGSQDLSQPELRLRDLDRMGIDSSVMYPSTLYARATADPEFEAALCRAYNRHVGQACRTNPKRLKWGGLLPLAHPREACEAIAEMQELGASAAVVWGTVGDKLLSDRAFATAFDELARAGLPLGIHDGMSYPPFAKLSDTMYAGHIVGMSFPVFLGFWAVVGGGLLDRYPNQKFAFLEFGSEWVLYMVPRLQHYWEMESANGLPMAADIPQQDIMACIRTGKIFIGCEAEDRYLPIEMELIGEDQILFASDIPHPEMRENAALEILGRADLTQAQKKKILYDNSVRFYGQP